MFSEKRNSYIFYRSFYEALEDLTDNEQLAIYKAITVYALEGKDPKITSYPKAIFRLIKPQLDANSMRYENGKKGAEYGKLGGRPKKETPNKPLNNPTETPNKNVNVNSNDNLELKSKVTPLFPQEESMIPFEKVWDIYDKKVGDKIKLKKKWDKLSIEKKIKALDHINKYVSNTEKQYRKNFETYLNNCSWDDEIIDNSISIIHSGFFEPKQKATLQMQTGKILLPKTEEAKQTLLNRLK